MKSPVRVPELRCYLAVHVPAIPYIRGLNAFVMERLAIAHGQAEFLAVTRSLDEVEIEAPAVVYLVGVAMPPVRRKPGVFYVLVNLNVITWLGNPLKTSLKGARVIMQKRRQIMAQAAMADAMLDYYPAQTPRLQRSMAIPVLELLPSTLSAPAHLLPMSERPYDLCFVGGLSRRRVRVLEMMRAADFKLSPNKGADLESLTAQSRLTLNIHFQAASQLEIPRIVGSLSTATPVLTEHSHGLSDLFQGAAVQECGLLGMVEAARAILSDEAELERRSKLAQAEFAAHHARACAVLDASCADIETMAAERLATT